MARCYNELLVIGIVNKALKHLFQDTRIPPYSEVLMTVPTCRMRLADCAKERRCAVFRKRH